MQTNEIISDDEVFRVHGHSNFGSMTPREVIEEGIKKVSIGFHCGHTQENILREHKLVDRKYNLTRFGKKYARAMHNEGRFYK